MRVFLMGDAAACAKTGQKVPMQWRRAGIDMHDFLADPAMNIGIFSPVVALGMTVNVVLGPVAFFFPSFSAQVPALLSYGVYLSIAVAAIIYGFVFLKFSGFIKPVPA